MTRKHLDAAESPWHELLKKKAARTNAAVFGAMQRGLGGAWPVGGAACIRVRVCWCKMLFSSISVLTLGLLRWGCKYFWHRRVEKGWFFFSFCLLSCYLNATSRTTSVGHIEAQLGLEQLHHSGQSEGGVWRDNGTSIDRSRVSVTSTHLRLKHFSIIVSFD